MRPEYDFSNAIRGKYHNRLVKGSNVGGIMAKPDVDGALVGGASLDLEDFVRIVRFRDQPID